MATDRRPSRSRRRGAAAVGAGVALLAGGGAAAGAVAATGDHGPARRLATVTRTSVVGTLESSGTVVSAGRVSVSFPVTGTVTTVDVSVGRHVTAGQVLAAIDPGALQAALDSAQAGLAQARQRLAADETGQAIAATGTSGTGAAPQSLVANRLTTATPTPTPTPTPSPTRTPTRTVRPTPGASPSPSGSTRTGGSPTGQLAAAQQAVIDAQRSVDTGQRAVDAAEATLASDVTTDLHLRDAQRAACAADPSSTPCTSARADYEAYADTLSAASVAQQAAVADQDRSVAALDSAISALARVLSALPASGNSGGAGGRSGSGGGSGSSTAPASAGRAARATGTVPAGAARTATLPSSGATASTNGATSARSGPASAAQLAADQAEVDAAAAQVTAAEHDLAGARLTSPITGRVAAVALTPGGPATGSVTVVGTGADEVTTTVPIDEVDLIRAGEPASVAVDGRATALQGRVVSRGLLSTTSGGVTTFPVVVRLDRPDGTLLDGLGADVTITTGRADGVLTVPDSALREVGTGAYVVTVVTGSTTRSVRVTVGVAGLTRTEVTSGLRAGDRVVLAELSAPLPTSATAGTATRFPGFLLGGVRARTGTGPGR